MLKTTNRFSVIRALQQRMEVAKTALLDDESLDIPIYYDNLINETPTDQSTFVRFTINFDADAERATTDANRQAGIAVAQVSTPLGKGTNESALITDVIEAIFKSNTWPDNVLQTNYTALFGVGADGSYYTMNVNIYFEYYK